MRPSIPGALSTPLVVVGPDLAPTVVPFAFDPVFALQSGPQMDGYERAWPSDVVRHHRLSDHRLRLLQDTEQSLMHNHNRRFSFSAIDELLLAFDRLPCQASPRPRLPRLQHAHPPPVALYSIASA